MSRILIHVEGETEESFVNDVLASHLYKNGFTDVNARLIGNARLRSRRGGIRSWSTVKKDIVNHLKEDPNCIATTMVDFYALPKNGAKAWPGRDQTDGLICLEKANKVEKELLLDISHDLGDDINININRFIPFVMMHEFEGLLFSDCDAFANGIGKPQIAEQFHKIREQFNSPEEINDSPITAPSKRIEALVAEYEKPIYGSIAILEIGLEKIMDQCPHFANWIATLIRSI